MHDAEVDAERAGDARRGEQCLTGLAAPDDAAPKVACRLDVVEEDEDGSSAVDRAWPQSIHDESLDGGDKLEDAAVRTQLARCPPSLELAV